MVSKKTKYFLFNKRGKAKNPTPLQSTPEAASSIFYFFDKRFKASFNKSVKISSLFPPF